MQSHPFLPDIFLHSTDELAEMLGADIVERETIHEWPLSCVQRLRLGDGTQLIYKSQLPPTVEPEFYERASSSLLPNHRALGGVGNCTMIILDWIDAPSLVNVIRGETELVDHGRRLIGQIGEIEGELPIRLDIGSPRAWRAMTETTLAELEYLVLDGPFSSIGMEKVRQLRDWARRSSVVDSVTECPRTVHGDLKAEQVFVADDGYRIVDWQRPLVGPPDVDLVSLLVMQKIDPRRYVQGDIIGVFWFLLLQWAVEAQVHIFPGFQGSLFNQWCTEATDHILELG